MIPINFKNTLQTCLNSRWGMHAAWGVVGLFGFLLIWECLTQTQHIFSSKTTTQKPAPSVPALQQAPGQITLAQLNRWQLFGQAGAAALRRAPSNLKLKGVFLSSNPKQHTAIIAHKLQEKVYTLGSQIPDGYTIKKILNNQVILQRSGQVEPEVLALFPNED